MANHYSSNNVKVFPSTNRWLYPQGKLTSERNFVNIINSLTDHKSYVLSWTSGELEVIINGYYFKVNLPSLSPNLYLSILVELTEYGQLVSWDNNEQLDSNDYFCGLAFSNGSIDYPSWITESQKNTKYRKYELQVTDPNNNIINMYRFNTDSVYCKNYNRILSTDLDRRQYRITAGTGLVGEKSDGSMTNEYSGLNKISINNEEMNKLDELEGKGNDTQFVYFNTSGIATPTSATVGGPSSGTVQGTGEPYILTRDIYMKKGIITAGRTIYASTSSPPSYMGSVGDIWLKYQN